MSQTKENLYEGMFIISARLSEDARGKALGRIEKDITQRGGEIKKVHDFHRRRLAYEIDGHKEGCYYVFYFTLRPEAVNELWREWHLNEDLLRYMTLSAEKVQEEKIEFAPITMIQ
jgi:small subunit ribosomal protein S6